jgi:hypothetical protein
VRVYAPGRDAELLEFRVGLAVLAFQQGDRPGQIVLDLRACGVQLLGGVVELAFEALLDAVLHDQLVDQRRQGRRVEAEGLQVGLVRLHSGHHRLCLAYCVRLGRYCCPHCYHRMVVLADGVFNEQVVMTTFWGGLT